MGAQLSTSGLHSTENLAELSNRSGEEVGEHESNVPTKIFTEEEEIALLKQITETDKQSHWSCKFDSIEMGAQPSTNGLHSTENLSELSNRLGEEVGEHESNVPTKIFTEEEEIALLKQITEADKQSLCICKFCSMSRLKILVYRVAREKKKLYPQSWDEDQQAESEWMKKFEERHQDKISKFPLEFKIALSQTLTNERQSRSNQILTLEEERSLLAHIWESKIQINCVCQQCVPLRVFFHHSKLVHNGMISYPKSWKTDEEAVKWLDDFKERHKADISQFPSICTMQFSHLWQLVPKEAILTFEEERSLLADIETKTETDCICQKCVRQKVSHLAYQQASEKKKIYPESWNENKKAGQTWLRGFAKRHRDQISKFPSNCKIKLSQLSTSELSSFSTENVSKISNNRREEVGKHKNNIPTKIFTEDEEILLLKQIKKKTQSSCICKSCSMGHLKRLIYQIAFEKKKPYPKSWNKDQQAKSEWMEKFEKRHKDKISKFPLICKMTLTQASTSEGQSSFKKILTLEEERSLLADIETNKIQTICICKTCVLQKVSFLAYIQASDKKKIYPESWNENKKVGQNWLKRFTKRHQDQISKFPSDCKRKLSLSTTDLLSSSTENVSKISNNIIEEVDEHENNVPIEVFTKEEEIALLKQIKEKKQSFCFCKSCSMVHLKRLAYQVACEKKKLYPQSWNEDQQAESEWMKKFEERHKDEISQFSSICKITFSQASTSNELEKERLLSNIEMSIYQNWVLI